MKILSTISLTVLLGAGRLWAHEEGAAHADRILGQAPEYLHVLLHPVLVVGLAVALMALVAGSARPGASFATRSFGPGAPRCGPD